MKQDQHDNPYGFEEIDPSEECGFYEEKPVGHIPSFYELWLLLGLSIAIICLYIG